MASESDRGDGPLSPQSAYFRAALDPRQRGQRARAYDPLTSPKRKEQVIKDKPWQDWVILAASGWLFFSPLVLGYAALSHPAAWVAIVCAIALFVSASEALVVPDAIEEWLDGGVAIAMLASPWVLGYSGDIVPMINSVAVGLLVLVFASLALTRDLQTSVTGHHWAART